MVVAVDAALSYPQLGAEVWAAPICISVRQQGGDESECDGDAGIPNNPWHYAEANVVPDTAAMLREHLYFQVVSLPVSSCISEDACARVGELARLTVGVVGSDAPSASMSPPPWEPVKGDVTVQAWVTTDSASSADAAVYLSRSRCDSPDEADAGVERTSVLIAKGQVQSNSFALCGPRTGGTYRIGGSVVDAVGNIAGVTSVPVPPSVAVGRFDSTSLSYHECGQPARALLSSDVQQARGVVTTMIHTPGVVRSSDPELCAALGDEPDASPDQKDCIGSVTLTLTGGQTCQVELGGNRP
jgi:hypothetical protein